jgi:hypothetical protein
VNSGTGGWVNAVLGNIATSGSLAGGDPTSYLQFLTDNGGWNGSTMLGAHGFDRANRQVWADIDHSSDFWLDKTRHLRRPGTGVAGSGRHRTRRLRTVAEAAPASGRPAWAASGLHRPPVFRGHERAVR